MKERLLNNLSLKIVSIVCAIVFWVIIVNVYDPSTSVTVSGVNVKLLNTEALTDKEYSYEIVAGDKISVYISGPRSIVTDINANDIEATADLSDVTVFSDYVDIDVKIIKSGVATASLDVAPKTSAIKLKVENRISKTVNVDTNVTGEPAEGYRTGNVQISPANIKITGKASLIDSVALARVNYDVTGATMDIADSAVIQLYDSDGNEIKDDRIEMSKTSADVRVSILHLKTVSVNYKTKGRPAEGYQVSNLVLDNNNVTIAGNEDTLKNIESISIPEDMLDLTGLKEDKTFQVNISSLLPEGVTLVSDNIINVAVGVYEVVEKTITVPPASVIVTGLPAGLVLSSYEEDITVTLVGQQTTLDGINESNIVLSVDLSKGVEGVNEVPVTLTVSSRLYALKEAYTAKAVLTAVKPAVNN